MRFVLDLLGLTAGFLIPIFWVHALHAAPGDSDMTFNGDGIVTTDIAGLEDDGIALAVQEDGKILVAGGATIGSDVDMAVLRYNADGSLDSEFDGDGIALTSFGLLDIALAMALQDDGRIVVSGGTLDTGRTVLARYDPDGSLDASFDGDGKAITDVVGGVTDAGAAIALQTDGKIVVAGGSAGAEGAFVVRYNVDGGLDNTFDGDGIALTDLGTDDLDWTEVAIQPDGKILVAGEMHSGDYDFAFGRFEPDGGLDASFNAGGATPGLLFIDFAEAGENDGAAGMALLPDGKIQAVGYTGNTDFDMALIRLNSDGSLDSTFGGDGKVSTDLGDLIDVGRGLARQADGKIVVVGASGDDFALARYNADGTLDPAFGTDGVKVADVGGGAEDALGTPVILSDGRFFAAGFTGSPATSRDVLLMRFLGDTADLKVSKSADGLEVSAGDRVDFSITVDNKGPGSVGGIVLTDALPAGLDLEASSVTASQGSCDASAVLTCDLGTLANGGTATVSYSAIASTVGTLTNAASVTAQGIDTMTLNNSSSVVLTVEEGGGCSLIR